jgi:diaminopimelate epimerase
MGNPHAVFFVEEEPREAMQRLGPSVESHRRFPRRVNAGFARVKNREHIELCVWERGSGPTLACGTGAAAAIVAGVLSGKTERRCRVTLPGGDLEIHWEEESGRVFKDGPATLVFDGVYNEE